MISPLVGRHGIDGCWESSWGAKVNISLGGTAGASDNEASKLGSVTIDAGKRSVSDKLTS